MNHDKLREVARAIEVEPEAFNMETWLQAGPQTLCGTIGCIAGTTVRLDAQWVAANIEYEENEGAPYLLVDDCHIAHDAVRMLDLPEPEDTDDDHPLFVSGYWWKQACEYLGLETGKAHTLTWITPKHASTVLYALADGTITFDMFDPWLRGPDDPDDD